MREFLDRDEALDPFRNAGYVEHVFDDGWTSLRPPLPSMKVVMLYFRDDQISRIAVDHQASQAGIPTDQFPD